MCFPVFYNDGCVPQIKDLLKEESAELLMIQFELVIEVGVIQLDSNSQETTSTLLPPLFVSCPPWISPPALSDQDCQVL